MAYASILGTFANHGVELLTPWNWEEGMWETMHLFSRYAQEYSISSVSSLENTVSAYSTVNESADSMTIILVNRDMNSSRNVTVNIDGYYAKNGDYPTLQLASLPAYETFKSHTDNALEEDKVAVDSNAFMITVPKLSITAVILNPTPTGIRTLRDVSDEMQLYPNPANDILNIRIKSTNTEKTQIKLIDQTGRTVLSTFQNLGGNSPVNLSVSSISDGIYFVSVKNNHISATQKFVKK